MENPQQQLINVDTLIANAMLNVNSIVNELCRALRASIGAVEKLEKENEALKKETEKLKADDALKTEKSIKRE